MPAEGRSDPVVAISLLKVFCRRWRKCGGQQPEGTMNPERGSVSFDCHQPFRRSAQESASPLLEDTPIPNHPYLGDGTHPHPGFHDIVDKPSCDASPPIGGLVSSSETQPRQDASFGSPGTSLSGKSPPGVSGGVILPLIHILRPRLLRFLQPAPFPSRAFPWPFGQGSLCRIPPLWP